MSSSWLVRKAMQRYWRWTRAMTLGARGAVLDEQGRVLLVRHTYMPGWTFPGGGVEPGETIETSLLRELDEEAGIAPTEPVQLFGLYSNAAAFPGDHVALFVVRAWRRLRVPEPNREIAEVAFFPIDRPPNDATAATRRRLAEITGRAAIDPMW